METMPTVRRPANVSAYFVLNIQLSPKGTWSAATCRRFFFRTEPFQRKRKATTSRRTPNLVGCEEKVKPELLSDTSSSFSSSLDNQLDDVTTGALIRTAFVVVRLPEP